MNLKFRPANESDIPFIIDSWLKAYLKSPHNKLLHKDVYFTEHRRAIEQLELNITVCCNPEFETQLYGYTAFTKKSYSVLHFIYVKQTYRGFKIASKLIDNIELMPTVFTTHYTEAGGEFLKKLKINHIFNPYLLWK